MLTPSYVECVLWAKAFLSWFRSQSFGMEEVESFQKSHRNWNAIWSVWRNSDIADSLPSTPDDAMRGPGYKVLVLNTFSIVQQQSSSPSIHPSIQPSIFTFYCSGPLQLLIALYYGCFLFALPPTLSFFWAIHLRGLFRGFVIIIIIGSFNGRKLCKMYNKEP